MGADAIDAGAHSIPRARPLLLLVEDCPDNREMYATYLRLRDFEVAEAHDGRTGLAQTLALQPDLVVMDLELPDMDGMHAIRRIRNDARTEHVPIVIVSGYGPDSGERDRGAWDAFLTKPIGPDVLAREIRRILSAAIERRLSAAIERRPHGSRAE